MPPRTRMISCMVGCDSVENHFMSALLSVGSAFGDGEEGKHRQTHSLPWLLWLLPRNPSFRMAIWP